MNLLSGGSAGQPKLSPRIAILGQHSYRPEERGLTDEGTNSVSAHIKRLEVSYPILKFNRILLLSALT